MTPTERTRSAGSEWTWNQYAVFRVLLGSYLTVHFAHLLPWGVELFSSEGMLATMSG